MELLFGALQMDFRDNHVVLSDVRLFITTFAAIVNQPALILLTDFDVIHVVTDFAEMHCVYVYYVDKELFLILLSC